MEIHIGQSIKEKCRELRISNTELGRLINTSSQNVSSIFKRKYLDTRLLFRISKALDYNFFDIYRHAFAEEKNEMTVSDDHKPYYGLPNAKLEDHKIIKHILERLTKLENKLGE